MLTDHRPSVDQLLTDTSVKYRPTIGEKSANEKLYRPRHIWNDRLSTRYRLLYRPTVDRVSTERRPSIDRLSTECRPTIDRVSTNYRPLYRPLSRSTLPTVSKIPYSFNFCFLLLNRLLSVSPDNWFKMSVCDFNNTINTCSKYMKNKNAGSVMIQFSAPRTKRAALLQRCRMTSRSATKEL